MLRELVMTFSSAMLHNEWGDVSQIRRIYRSYCELAERVEKRESWNLYWRGPKINNLH